MKNYRYITIGVILIILLFSVISTSSISKNTFSYNKNTSKPVILITGFGPFDDYDINPSQLVVEYLNGLELENARIIGQILPVDFSDSVLNLKKTIDDLEPIVLISLGLDGTANSIEIENIGLNIKRVKGGIIDRYVYRKIDTKGPWIRLSTLPTKLIVNELKNNNIPVRHSFFAGTYVCNSVMYEAISYMKNNYPEVPTGFIHIPLLSTQHSDGMEFSTMTSGVLTAINASLSTI